MLKHSTRLMLSHQRLFHASGALYKIQLHNVNLQNKVLEIKDVAISRYNQIIGYEEIEIAYQQITKLQVMHMHWQFDKPFIMLLYFRKILRKSKMKELAYRWN